MNLDDILEKYSPAIHRVAASYTPPGASREDLEQEIALAVMKAAKAFRNEASMSTYIFRIAHNCGIDAIKSRKTTNVEFEEGRHHSSQVGPEAMTLKNERREQLAAAIRGLPISIRQPLVLRLEGLSYQEIADVLDLTTSNVGVRLHRASAELKKRVGRMS